MAKRKVKKKASAKEINLEHWLKQKLRRISYQWPAMKEVVQKARVARGKYRCAVCSGENFGPKDIQRDHIHPVDDPETGFTNWDKYIIRLFCYADQLQVLCKTCHKYKSELEQSIRRQVRNEKNGNKGEL